MNANSVHSVTAILVEQLAGVEPEESSFASIKALTFLIVISGILLMAQTFMINKDQHERMMIVGALNCIMAFIIIILSIYYLRPKTKFGYENFACSEVMAAVHSDSFT